MPGQVGRQAKPEYELPFVSYLQFADIFAPRAALKGVIISPMTYSGAS